MREPSELPRVVDDRRLVDAAVGGDLHAFTVLFDRYRVMLLGRCVRELRDVREAEDVVQETFIRAVANIERFDPDRPLWPWIATIAHRLCVDFLRRRARATLVDDSGEEFEERDFRELGAEVDDLTFQEVCARETRDLLARAIGELPPRQRRTLLLRELEGWDYADIAAAEATTVSSVKALLFRARTRLREAYATMGALGLVAILVRPIRRARERLRTSMVHLEGPGTATMAQVASGVVAFALIVGAASPVPSDAARGITRAAAGPSITATSASDPAAAAAERARARNEAATEPAADLIEDLTDPNADVKQPEDAQIRSFASAGDTVFAVGVTHCRGGMCPAVLFRSDDAGGSWKRLAAEGLKADQILLSPGFGSTDARIFAMGATGLQVSEDGGATFTAVAPAAGRAVVGSAAISPAFEAGDPRILIGGQNLMEYRDDAGTFQPSATLALPGPLEPAFAPDYPADDRIVVGGRDVDPETGMLVPAVFVCSSAACTRAPLSGYPKPPKVRPSSRYLASGALAVFTRDGLWLSHDGGVTFHRVSVPWSSSDIVDAAWLGDEALGVVVTAKYGTEGDSGLYVLERSGAWSRSKDRELRSGARALISASDVAFVALPARGLACSTDAGQSWRERC